MQQPDDEDMIWGKLGNVYPNSGSPKNDTLLKRFPELMRAGGGVDPQEAIVSLLDRITELEAKLDGLRRDSKPS